MISGIRALLGADIQPQSVSLLTPALTPPEKTGEVEANSIPGAAWMCEEESKDCDYHVSPVFEAISNLEKSKKNTIRYFLHAGYPSLRIAYCTGEWAKFEALHVGFQVVNGHRMLKMRKNRQLWYWQKLGKSEDYQYRYRKSQDCARTNPGGQVLYCIPYQYA